MYPLLLAYIGVSEATKRIGILADRTYFRIWGKAEFRSSSLKNFRVLPRFEVKTLTSPTLVAEATI